jgi:lysosomal alpha-mannosidase
MEKLIVYLNKNNKINMTFKASTPGRFVDELKKEDSSYPVFYNDMFPYSDAVSEYWSGFFSSRPASKLIIKYGSSFLQASS